MVVFGNLQSCIDERRSRGGGRTRDFHWQAGPEPEGQPECQHERHGGQHRRFTGLYVRDAGSWSAGGCERVDCARSLKHRAGGDADGDVGPITFVRSDSISDSVTGFSDLTPQATLYWNKGVHNFMVYGTGNLPVGAYQSSRLSNLGLGHGAMDAGGGYTYYNEDTGYEFSAVAGLTYNLTNTTTNYQSGVDFHLDWGASKYLTDDLFIGPVGYFYNQIGCDSGSGDRVGCFKSQVAGLGAEVGYSFPVRKLQGYLNLKGYGEFAAQNRASGWNLWLTFSISPPESEPVPLRGPKLHK
jgi:Putative MetA-pathway of phenol degradation